MKSHHHHTFIPLSMTANNRDLAGFLIMDIVTHVLMQSQRDGCIYVFIFLCHSITFIFINKYKKFEMNEFRSNFLMKTLLHRNIYLILRWQCVTFGRQLGQSATDEETCITRFYYIVDITILCCLIWIGEHFCIFVFLLSEECLRIFGCLGFLGT